MSNFLHGRVTGPQYDDLKAAASEAQERFGDDELERHAAEKGWPCRMCGHFSPKRFRKRCQRCGAYRDMR